MEDEESVAASIKKYLEKRIGASVVTAPDCSTAREILVSNRFDLVTLDYMLPDCDGLELLEEITGMESAPPVVMVTGHGDEKAASEAFRLGAAGYVVKDFRLASMLIAAAERALELTRVQRWLLESEERFRNIVESSRDAIFIIDFNGDITYWNPAAERVFGHEAGEAVGRNVIELLAPPEATGRYLPILDEFQASGGGFAFEETALYDVVRKDRARIQVEVTASSLGSGGERAALVTAHDVSERERSRKALEESERKVRRKLEALLEPSVDVGALELPDIIDVEAVQSLMDDFNRVTSFSVGVTDVSGEVIVASGWQEICTRFHRAHPETARYCMESDAELATGAEPGSFKLYRCKNNMWDMATPIIVGDYHVGNLHLGQFFFEDEIPDYELFRQQAWRYGFDERKYMAALERVPRWSRETVETVMAFCTRMAGVVSALGYSQVRLARALARKDADSGASGPAAGGVSGNP
ncbi:MAG: PocR ligand-binding domain-containing protein [Actinomycetota bacterium]